MVEVFRRRCKLSGVETDPGGDIFVAIAAYREPELRLTIESCVRNATHPERLTFGVCLQYDRSGPAETQPDCLDGLEANIRLSSFDWTESKGGCWARHHAQGLFEEEEFTLQIDSHMRMEPDWDRTLIEMTDRFPGDKPLITGQCPLFRRVDGRDVFPSPAPPVPVTIIKEYVADGWVFHPAIEIPDETGSPRPTRVLSGMFVFTMGRWNREVRQDPEHLYTGEEFALTIRSFTWGYDLYNPDQVVAWHRYHPEGNIKYIHEAEHDEVQFRDQRAYRRLRALHRGDPDRILAPYTVGSERSVEEFCAWSGLDFDTLSISDAAMNGVAPPEFHPSW